MPDEEAGPARRHLLALAHAPRPAGSAAEADARSHCRAHLESHGFSVTEEPFTFSSAIGRWLVPVACSVVGLALGAAGLWWRGGGAPWAASLGLSLLLAGVAWIGRWGARVGVLSFPWARVASANLVAVRGTPSWWFVAHLDSKSQPMPTLVRATLLVLLGASLLGSIALGVSPVVAADAWVVPLVGASAGVALSLATVGTDSHGAVDNASGVAVILRLAELLPPGVSLGVVLPSAEELGLAGMRAWVRGRPAGRAVNIDTVDDRGLLRVMVHGVGGRAVAAQVAATGAAAETRVGPLLPGLLTDGVAMADAGWEVVTVSRGTLATLGRIHRPADHVRQLDGHGVEATARRLATLLGHPT